MKNIINTDKQTCSICQSNFSGFKVKAWFMKEINVVVDTLRIKVPTYISVCITL